MEQDILNKLSSDYLVLVQDGNDPINSNTLRKQFMVVKNRIHKSYTPNVPSAHLPMLMVFYFENGGKTLLVLICIEREEQQCH
jgi:hypothetical protein